MLLLKRAADRYLNRAADRHGTSGDESGITSLTIQATDKRLDMIKSWIKACDEHHGSQCCIPKADASIWPMWVIDVVDECIVEGDIADRYLTLSYVWGGVQTLQATTANIEQLKQPGSLTRDKVILPKTIRQAMNVTRLLGERYIWIDQLSILQDDEEHKHGQIKHMAEIYANSYLTLAAVTGKAANSGLADDIDQMLNETPLNKEYYKDNTTYFMEGFSIWNRRGWTFQERVFSRRTLFFHDLVASSSHLGERCPKSLYWVCQRTWWYDWHYSIATEACRSVYKDMTKATLSQSYRWPNFDFYMRLCRSYSPRNFTYDCDVVIAFAGAATLLAKSFPGGILYGLPVILFDIALLWDYSGSASKRLWDATSDESNRPPSWSWMSRHGEALWYTLGSTAFKGIAYTDKASTLAITPLVQWYFTGVGGAQIAITNEYHKYKHFAQDGESTPPPGWSRAESSSISSGTYRENVYVTPNAPEWKFRFPIPLVNPSCSDITIPMPISNRITCQTEHAYFHMRNTKSVLFLQILDAMKKSSGLMGLPEDWDRLCLETETRVELIAISTGSGTEYQLWHGSDVPEQHREPCIWDFYNVLWIEWIAGVAYRKAVGYVVKSAWEAADREFIDVILG